MSHLVPGDEDLHYCDNSHRFVRLYFRMGTVLDWSASDGWVWLKGYEVNILGEALVERHIFVQAAGVVVLDTRTAPAVGIARTQQGERSCAE